MLLYMDCFSGLSGDMWISSLLSLGVRLDDLGHYMRAMNLGVELHAETCTVSGIACQRFAVKTLAHQPLRHLADIEQCLRRVPDASIRETAYEVFVALAEAEAKVHATDPGSVHFHEIGAVDTIVDVVGVLYGLRHLQVKQVQASPLPWSRGMISIDHGKVPLPAPATALLLKDIPCYGVDAGIELVTPTAGALMKVLVSHFGEFPVCFPQAVGYGAGSLQRSDGVPNLVRAVLARPSLSSTPWEAVAVLECEMDDINPEWFSHIFAELLSSPQVLDFYVTSVQMKKNRPGFLLTVLCPPAAAAEVAQWVLSNTTTLGVRITQSQRLILARQESLLDSPWGPVRCKIAFLPDGSRRYKLEFEDCLRISQEHGIPLAAVYAHLIQP